jgi:hypothetical protein
MMETTASRLRIWLEGSINSTETISGDWSFPINVFVSINGDIYVDTGRLLTVEKWTLNATSGVTMMNENGRCYGLFVDINSTIYCSMQSFHMVIKKSINSGINTAVAGNGTSGSASNMLDGPNGIFVDTNFNLYVADSRNDRIQRFANGQMNGTTVAGNGESGAITLSGPQGVTLDADGYLFIIDAHNNRIIGLGPNGFRCIVGCSNSVGSTASTLDSPGFFAFDSYGNIFVTDTMNNRIQKFILANNSCGKFGQNLIET